MKIKTILVDDEKRAITILKGLLDDFEEVEVVGAARSVDEAVPLVLDHKPDLVFLDVQMPGKRGFQLLHELKDYDLLPSVIFVTAYDEYAISAIRHAAFDYLLKPVDPAELKKAIYRFRTQEGKKRTIPDFRPHKIKFPLRSRTVFLEPQEIIFVQAEGNYSELFLTENRKQMVSLYLSDVLEKLPSECFLRISRSHAINLNYLSALDRKKRLCTLKAEEKEYVLKVPVKYLKILDEGLG